MNVLMMVFIGVVASMLDPINAAIGMAVGLITRGFIIALVLGLIIAGVLQLIVSSYDPNFHDAFEHITATEIYVACSFAIKYRSRSAKKKTANKIESKLDK